MARLLVEAVSREYTSVDRVWHLMLFVSVSRADDGSPVTGLKQEHFRICSPLGHVLDMNLVGGSEAQWEPTDTEPAGCYSLSVTRKQETGGPPILEWVKGEFYPFGIQVRVRDRKTKETHLGQTVVRVESLGR